MTDADILQARKAHYPDANSVAVPAVESHSGADQYPNPFQHQPNGQRQEHGRSHQQQHYNIMIPTIEHWPALFMQGLKTTAIYTVEGLKQLHIKFQEYTAANSGSYQVLPTTNLDASRRQQQQQDRQTAFTFGTKRQLKQGRHQCSVSGRRLTRLLCFLVLVVTTIVLLVVSHRWNPLEERAIWIRYFTHEEPIKIYLPYGFNVHVSDVKKEAVKDMQVGFSTINPGNVRLISRNYGVLPADAVWDNNKDYMFGNSGYHPIIAVETKYGKLLVSYFQLLLLGECLYAFVASLAH